jgi:hypothetical protein
MVLTALEVVTENFLKCKLLSERKEEVRGFKHGDCQWRTRWGWDRILRRRRRMQYMIPQRIDAVNSLFDCLDISVRRIW